MITLLTLTSTPTGMDWPLGRSLLQPSSPGNLAPAVFP